MQLFIALWIPVLYLFVNLILQYWLLVYVWYMEFSFELIGHLTYSLANTFNLIFYLSSFSISVMSLSYLKMYLFNM